MPKARLNHKIKTNRASGMNVVHRLAMIASIESLNTLTCTRCSKRLTTLLQSVKDVLEREGVDDDEDPAATSQLGIKEARMQIEQYALQIELERLQRVADEINDFVGKERDLIGAQWRGAVAQFKTTQRKRRLPGTAIDDENIETPPGTPIRTANSDTDSVVEVEVESLDAIGAPNYCQSGMAKQAKTQATAAEAAHEIAVAAPVAYDEKTKSIRPKVIYSQEFLLRYAFPPPEYHSISFYENQPTSYNHHQQSQQQQQQQQEAAMNSYFNINSTRTNRDSRSFRNPRNLIYVNQATSNKAEPIVPGLEPLLLEQMPQPLVEHNKMASPLKNRNADEDMTKVVISMKIQRPKKRKGE